VARLADLVGLSTS